MTPFRQDGSVDLDAFRSLCSHLLDNGSDGRGDEDDGRAPTLDDDERFALYETAVDAIGDRGTVVAGAGTYSTAHTIHLTGRAHDIGVDGFLDRHALLQQAAAARHRRARRRSPP